MNISEFTFVVISYNHSQYIEECLDSIKTVITNYGKGVSTDLIICDDHSADQTVSRAESWIKRNRNLFRNTLVIENPNNMGVVRNLLNGVSKVKTKEFKFLAGDDKFGDHNIFKIYDSFAGSESPEIIDTPVIRFGNVSDDFLRKEQYTDRADEFIINKGFYKSCLRYYNFIHAAGVFIPGNYLRDEGLKRFLLSFRNIEDYPMWYYFFIVKNYGFKYLDEPYIWYRVGSGVSTGKKSKTYATEEEEMYQKLHARYNVLPKYFNPFYYQMKIIRGMARISIKRTDKGKKASPECR